jgi:hypothetical protein
MLHHAALVRTDVSEELSASFISVVPSSPILVTLMETLATSETSVLTRATWRNITEDTVLEGNEPLGSIKGGGIS